MEPTAMGLPGVAFTPGLHICAFYRGPTQRDELLLPYLREGLAAGDKCICVTDDPAQASPSVIWPVSSGSISRRLRRSCSPWTPARPICRAGVSRSRR